MKKVLSLAVAALALLALFGCGGGEEEIKMQPQLSDTYSNVAVGGVHRVTANMEVTWSSSDPSVATVQDGVITGVGTGTATITAAAGEETVTHTVKVGGDLLAIGDSIFTTDFSPNMLDKIASNLGYTLMRDTISGSTIVSRGDGMSIVEHIDDGLYDRLYSKNGPDVILIGRGTNDIYWSGVSSYRIGEADSVDKTETCGAVRYALTYFRDRFPKARIVWSNSIWRHDVNMEQLDALNSKIAEICASFKAEIIDLRGETGINEHTAGAFLADGVHPNPNGQSLYIDVITRALRKDVG